MNAREMLLAEFHRLAEVPDAVPRLRRFVLDLAVRGKLVEQDADDESASRALSTARRYLEDLAGRTGRLRWRASDPIKPPEAVGDLPRGWTHARLNDTGLYINGLAFKPSDWGTEGLPIIRIQNLTDPAKPMSRAKGEFPDEVLVRPGDILVSWSATLEAFRWDREMGVLNQHIFRVIPATDLVSPGFLLLLLRHAIRVMAEGIHAHGLVMTHINRGPFLAHVVAVPPLAEQRRIVAKVDELMALCDRLEEAQGDREARRGWLAAASMHRVRGGDGQSDSRQLAPFFLSVLQRLTLCSTEVGGLRETIFSLAVRGRLIAQEESDGSADALVSQLQGERERQRGSNAPRKQRSSPAESERDHAFRVPMSWRWLRMEDCFDVTGGIQKTPERTPHNNPYPYVGVSNVYRGRLDLSVMKQFELREGELERYRLAPGDILVVEGNGSATEIGRCAVWTGAVDNCVHQNHIIRCRPLLRSLVPFVIMYLNSPAGIETMMSLSITSSGLYSLSVGKIRAVEVPIPPLAEQQRIVAKVDALMGICDRLEANLTTGQTAGARLLAAVLHKALADVA